MAGHGFKRAGAASLGVFVLLGPGARTARAQETLLGVQVEQVAGSDIYLSAGIEDGIQTEDTVFVRRDADSDVVGTLRVLSAARRRSVASFAGDAFAITRGDSLYLSLAAGRSFFGPREPGAQPSGIPRTTTASVGSGAGVGPTMTGRVSLDFAGYRTTTQGVGINPETIDRDFATPTAALRARISRLPGDLAFNANFQVRYRYSSDDIVEPPEAFRVYQASFEKSSRVLHVQAGRFYNPYETFSGYWDGAMIRVGGNGLGGGIAAGFEPERANEGVSTTLPKYSGFIDVATGGGSARYQAGLSLTTVRPRDSLPDHTFGAFGQRLQVGGVRLDQSIQVDHDPDSGGLAITYLRAGASAPLSRKLTAYGGYFMRRPYVFGLQRDIIASRQDRVNFGLSAWMLSGVVSGDFAVSQMEDGETNYTYSTSFNFPRTALAELGISGAASYWTQGTDDRGLFIAPAVSRFFGNVNTRLMYQLYLTESADTPIRSHTGDLSLTFPLARQLYATVRLRGQRGDLLNSTGVFTSIWLSF
jgi:hypothetical protein